MMNMRADAVEKRGAEPKEEAIIIIPGIMASQLYTDEDITVERRDGEIGTSNRLKKYSKVWIPAGFKRSLHLIDERIDLLRCDEAGEPLYSLRAPMPLINNQIDNDEDPCKDRGYGVVMAYKNLYTRLYKEFGGKNSRYDVILYEYDWRKDPLETAKELDHYIDSRHYKKLIMIVHSMGGMVGAYFLALGEAQRKIIDKYISIASPYLGNEKIPYIMLTGKVYSVAKPFPILYNSIRRIVCNIPSIYALLPFEQKEYWSDYLFKKGKEGKLIPYKSSATAIEAIKRVFSNMDGEDAETNQWNDALFQKAMKNREILFQGRSHIISASGVDAYYFVGTGHETPSYVLIDRNGKKMTAPKKGDGDGTVTDHSSQITIRSNENDAGEVKSTLMQNRTYVCDKNRLPKNSTHLNIILKGSPVPGYICEIIRGSVDEYSRKELLDQLGIELIEDRTE